MTHNFIVCQAGPFVYNTAAAELAEKNITVQQMVMQILFNNRYNDQLQDSL